MGIVRDTLQMFNLTTAPDTPPTGRSEVYVKDYGLWLKNDLGFERPLIQPDTAFHNNPDFESGNVGEQPWAGTGWGNFWGSNGTWTWDTSTAILGSRSAKVVSTSTGDNIRIGNGVYTVIPGSTIKISAWGKVNTASGNLEIGFFTTIPANDPDFFQPDVSQQYATRACGTNWTRVEATFTVPPGHTKVRIYFSFENNRTWWIDGTGSMVTSQPPAANLMLPYTPLWKIGNAGTPTTGSGGFLSGFYRVEDDMVDYEINFRLGNGFTATAGTWSWTLPVAPLLITGYSNVKPGGVAMILDDLNTWFPSYPVFVNTNQVALINASGSALVSATSPMTFVWGDSLNISGRYRKA